MIQRVENPRLFAGKALDFLGVIGEAAADVSLQFKMTCKDFFERPLPVRRPAAAIERVVFETGPLSIWHYHGFQNSGLPAICIDARHAARALDLAPNKKDANDADGLAQLAVIGHFKEVRVKGFDGMLTRTLVAARAQLVRMTVELSNQICGLTKTFGFVVPAGRGSTFEKDVHNLLARDDDLAKIILPMLAAWRALRERSAELGRRLNSNARNGLRWRDALAAK